MARIPAVKEVEELARPVMGGGHVAGQLVVSRMIGVVVDPLEDVQDFHPGGLSFLPVRLKRLPPATGPAGASCGETRRTREIHAER
jgi:hypothetical protein